MSQPVDPTVVQDVVIVIPGIMGSSLIRSDGRSVWSLRPGTLIKALATLGRSLDGLKLDLSVGDGPADDDIRPGELLPGLHVIPGIWSPVAGYSGLINFLRSSRFHLVEANAKLPGSKPNLIQFPYDWRLSNRYNATLLRDKAFSALEQWRDQPGMREAKLILVCHSMGGLIARWFTDVLGGAEVTRHLITIGTPHRGSVNALDMLANGIEHGVGPLRFKLTETARSLPSMHQLLPTYRCLVDAKGDRSGITGVTIPGINSALLGDAAAFHETLDSGNEPEYHFHKVVGIRQPTLTTAQIVGEKVRVYGDIDGLHQGGDGTVPRLAAEPETGRGNEVHEVSDQHGELQGTASAMDLIDGILSRQKIIWQGAGKDSFGVDMREIWGPEEDLVLNVPDIHDRLALVTVLDESGNEVGPPIAVGPGGTALLGPLPPGGYRARVAIASPGGPPPVTRPFLVWDSAIDGGA